MAIITRIIMIDDDKTRYKSIQRNAPTIINNYKIDLATNKTKLLVLLSKYDYQIALINSDLQWENINNLIELITNEQPLIGKILINDRIVNFTDNLKFKIDAYLNNFENNIPHLEDAFDFVAERILEKKMLRLLNKEYRELFNNVPVGLLRIDYIGTILACNKEFASMLEFEHEYTLLTSKIQDFCEHQNFLPFRQMADLLIKSESYNKFQQKLITKNGKTIWTEITLKPKYDDSGILLYIDCVVQNITEKKELEMAILEKERTLEEYLDATNTFFAVINVNGKIELVNQALADFHGMSKNELIGKDWTDFIQEPKTKQIFLEHIKKVQNKPFNKKTIIGTATRKNCFGEDRFILWQNSFMLDRAGKVQAIISSGTDITEQLKLQKQLVMNTELFNKLLETTPDAIAILNLEGEITFINNQFDQLLSCSETNPCINQPLENFVEEKDKKRLLDCLKLTISRGMTGFNEYNFVRNNNSTFPMELSTTVLLDDKNTPWGILLVGRDISERKKFIQQLKRSELKYRQLFNAANDAIYVTKISPDSIQDRIIEVNDFACQRYGYTKEEFAQLSIFDLIAPENKAKAKENRRKILEQKHCTFESKHVTKSGIPFPVEISSHLFDLENERLIVSIVRDISKRKEYEEKLRQSEELYRTIFENTGTSMAVVDNNYRISICNELFTQLTGYSKAELLELGWLKLIHPNDVKQLKSLSRERRERPEPFNRTFEFRLVTKDGLIRTIKAFVASIPGTSQSVISLIDVSEEKMLEEVKRISYEQIELNLKQFAVLIDKIRNSLAIITASLDMEDEKFVDEIFNQIQIIDSFLKQIDQRTLESINVRNFLRDHPSK